MSRKHIKTLLSMLLLASLLLQGGCTAMKSIKEDSIHEDLPQIDPEAGLSRDITATLYYRLENEPYLVGVRHSVAVRSDETPETAIVQTLLTGVPLLSENVENVFPAGTEAVNVARDGSILYITLSEEFMDNDPTLQDEELYVRRRMGLYAIVNSVTAYEPDVRVMVSVMRQGAAGRLRYAELGMQGAGTSLGFLEPMSFEEKAVVTPENILDCVLRHMIDGQPAFAYDLFAETESGEGQKPPYEAFVAAFNEGETVAAYALNGYTILRNTAYATVDADITLVDEAGNIRTIENAQVRLKREGDLYLVEYYAFQKKLGRGVQ